MQTLTLQQFADYCEDATITQSTDCGFAIVHIGNNALGQPFVALNHADGNTFVTEAL